MAKGVPTGYTRFLRRFVEALSSLAQVRAPQLADRLRGAKLLSTGYQVSLSHPKMVSSRWSFRQNRITSQKMSKTFNVEFTPHDFQGLSASKVERAWHDSGLPGVVGFDESEIFFQREWGYGRETDRLVADHDFAEELRNWAVDAMSVAIELVEREEHDGTRNSRSHMLSLNPSTSGRASSGRSLPMESQLEDLIIVQWERFDFGADLEYIGRQIPCGNIGVLDILARDRDTRAYVVMELKKGEADDQEFGQLARYMGWVIKNMAAPEGVGVEGIIIAFHLSSKLQSAAASHSGVSPSWPVAKNLWLFSRRNG